jgi:hypothetical protein
MLQKRKNFQRRAPYRLGLGSGFQNSLSALSCDPVWSGIIPTATDKLQSEEANAENV